MKLTKVSASKIKCYKQCRFKFCIEYHWALPTLRSFAALQGTLCHSVFEEFGKAKRAGEPPPKDWLDIVLKAYRVQDIWNLNKKAVEREKDCKNCEHHNNGTCFVTGKSVDKFVGCPRNEFNEALELINGVILDKGPNNPLNKKIIGTETRFNIDAAGVPVNGIIDVVTEEDPTTIEIWDYKTGKFMMSYDECKTDPQLLIYHLAGRKIYTKYKNILVTIFYLQDKPITLAFDEKDERGTQNALTHYWYKIKNDRTPTRRCDRSDGTINFDWQCKGMCNPELCQKKWDEFVSKDGGVLKD